MDTFTLLCDAQDLQFKARQALNSSQFMRALTAYARAQDRSPTPGYKSGLANTDYVINSLELNLGVAPFTWRAEGIVEIRVILGYYDENECEDRELKHSIQFPAELLTNYSDLAFGAWIAERKAEMAEDRRAHILEIVQQYAKEYRQEIQAILDDQAKRNR